jgi:hypothetical protein
VQQEDTGHEQPTSGAKGVDTQKFVKPVLPIPQTQAESGYTSVFSDAITNLPDRSEILLYVPTVSATSLEIPQLVIQFWSSPCLHQVVARMGLIRIIYLFIYLFV